MSFGWRAIGRIWIVAGVFLLAMGTTYAQKKAAPASGIAAARAVLVEKAHALDARGRPDMAIQMWRQILASDPVNAEALAGLARDLKLTGATDQANQALDRLRRINPNDPNIAKIQALASTRVETDQLQRAGALARQGKAEEAMRVYRQLYGDHPPDGDIGLAYYQTLYGTASGKAAAVAGLKAMAARNPGDARFAIQLGVLLTYNPSTRSEGIRILQAHAKDASAQAALRQALIWDAANPARAAELRAYVKEHPQDSEMADHLKTSEAKLAQMNAGIARTPAEKAAFAALNAHRLEEAQRRFAGLLEEDARNGRAAAGMGFLRMQQKNFAAAISYLTQAEQNGYRDRSVSEALETARFWSTMNEASAAFDENRLEVAQAKYKTALEMNPRSPEALNGLAGLLVKMQQYEQAAEVYEQMVRIKPGASDGWRGLFLAYARQGQNDRAMATSNRFPAAVRSALNRDPEYLRTLASVYQAEHRQADAQRVLAMALALPVPEEGGALRSDTKLQYAGLLMEARRFEQAVELYAQILAADAASQPAWMGLVSAHHELGQDTAAIADLQKMPPSVYEGAIGDPGFLSMLAAIYQQANQLEVAQNLLERAMKLEQASGGRPGLALNLQLAGIYLRRNLTDQAYAIYHRVLSDAPESVEAWKGLLTTLQATHHDAEALQEIAQIPAPVRHSLESDIEFVQMEASLYATTGDTKHATELMARIEQHYARLRTQPPATVEVQNAWLLYNTGNDKNLYQALMKLGGRADLTIVDRQTVQEIWANWSVRRATAAIENGNYRRAVDILDAAYQAFPDNQSVRKAVAGGYAQVGRTKESLAIFKTIPMQDASSGDFQGAVGAALAANDKAQAELWLRQALERYPRDPAILSLAARYEQARGDNQRAAEYYRASLAAMPSASPVDRLAHTLAYPDQDTRAHKAVTAADLQRLLDPANEPFRKTTKLPPLPAYGPDPYEGRAPVVLPRARGSAPSESTVPVANPAVNHGAEPVLREQSARNLGDGVLHLSPAVNRTGGLRSSSRCAWAAAPESAGEPLDEEAGAEGSVLSLHPVGLQNVGGDSGRVQIQLNPPHSQASDAWKGLIFSLVAAKRKDEALSELAKVPVEVRRQLESDIEFVQGIASLYMEIGDVPRAMAAMNRVEDFYQIRRASAPVGLELQHAWLLLNLSRDAALYPVLMRLDGRSDASALQRQEIGDLWATWAVRRANADMAAGNLRRGVAILQAASRDYPENLAVRRAVAGAYARVGRAKDALALFKTIPLTGAGAGDYQGAIEAALGAGDLAQAEAWLRQALGAFPADPQILGSAARFEQARGNNARATEYWRAALAAMPADTSMKPLDSYLPEQAGSEKMPEAGDTKRLLDPRRDPAAAAQTIPLPSYRVPSSIQPQSSQPSYGAGTSHSLPDPLPLGRPATFSSPGPVLIEQSSTDVARFVPAMRWMQTRSGATKKKARTPQSYEGQVHLPPDEQVISTVDAVEPAPEGQAPAAVAPAPVWTPRLQEEAQPATGLRITAQPMNPLAAEILAMFAEQTDSQLTQGSATLLKPAQASVPLPSANLPKPALGRVEAGRYDAVQYTPSAQEAATGAYSAPGQGGQIAPALPLPQPQSGGQVAQPKPALHQQSAPEPVKRRAIRKQLPRASETREPERAATHEQVLSEPILRPEDQLPQAPVPQTSAQNTSGAGLSDEELQQRNLPPLRGPWVRIQRQARPLSPREEAERQLQTIESGYSSWLGGTGMLNYRSGSLGFDHLTAFEVPFEASLAAGYHARLSIIARPVFLDSGQADGTAQISVLESTTSGTSTTTIAEPIGTLTTTDSTPPAQQNAVGLGGEVQLAFPQLAIAAGSTPYGFLVQTFTGRFYWKPANGPFTFSFNRDSVKDSQLSYSGLRDPAGNSLGVLGQVWGGVVANSGNIQYAKGDAQSGFYLSAGGQYITGYKVMDNKRIDGSGGAYWRVMTQPEYGSLNIGVNFFAMHYDKNLDAFTHGMGGYFSPQGYFLANVPFSWTGHYETHWHYNVAGGLGLQAFQENQIKLWPLTEDTAMETSMDNPLLPDKTSVGSNYDLHGQVSYQISPHWFAGGYLSANNTRNYSSVSTGFFVRFLFREQPSTATAPTGLFPSDGLRPFTVP